MKNIHAVTPFCKHKDCAEDHNASLTEQIQQMAELVERLEEKTAQLTIDAEATQA